jgi:hypothetical protein
MCKINAAGRPLRAYTPCMATRGTALRTVVFALTLYGPAAGAFDFDNGNAPIEVVIPAAIPAIFGMSPGGNDASLVLRVTTMITNSWFDAIAPYHPTAVGVNSRLGRRPAGEATTRNKNTAILYSSYRVLNSLFPGRAEEWRDMLKSVGLNPDDDSQNTATPTGIGNMAGKAVAAARERDGMNQLGDEGGRKYNLQPYADYTGYKPVNTAYELKDPSRWQPNITTMGNGIFRVQQFVTPQWRLTRPHSYQNPNKFPTPPPQDSSPQGARGRQAYQRQADEVLAASAALTDYQKMIAELFDNKIFSLGFSALFISQTRNFTLDQFVHYDFLTNMAAFDAGIACWNQKARWDAVRPFSAIRYLYGDRPVTAWGGPGRGTVFDLPASQWRSYLETADHPEYPSGSACFCAAHGQASRRFLGSDNLGWSVPAPQGSSRVEPGVTPSSNIVLGPWDTWTDFERECGLSRFWGGVHFMPAITEGAAQCKPVGDLAYEFVRAHIEGTAK